MANARLTLGLLVAVLCGIAATPARGGSAIRRSVNARVRVISLPSDSARFDLPGEWIRGGSVHATLDGVTLQPGADYELEMTEGILRLLRPLPAGRLTVRYEVIPLSIGRIFQAPIPPDTGSVARVPIPPRSAGEAAVASRAHLDIRGSKTVSLEIGNTQDLTVRQSLDVSLSGEVVEGVRVRGVLSDRQTPLQAEGRTTDLSDLDRVFLEVEGPGAGMILGDFVLRGPAGLFTRYERQLEGIRLTGRAGEGSASVAAATIPGVFRSIEFLGVEGKQGPYSLRPPETTTDAAVVAGTERVWLDGELLVRGEDRDYLIDYAASTMTFTGRRVVNQASRITVDCQIGTQPYRRNAYAAEAGWGAAARPDGHGLGLRASVLAERDDRGHPIGGALTAREKEILSAAGDSLSDSLNAGVDCGAIGHGDYEQVEADSLVQPFFRFVGDSLGTCAVRFDDVGVGRGDYLDSLSAGGKTIYRFVGLRRGRFAPGRAVPRPSERSLVDLLGIWAGPGGLTLEMEGAGSSDDPNTYSDRDDADRTGGALRLRFARETAPVRALGRSLGNWGVELESRDVEPRFRAIGRVDPGWLGYDWGVASDRFGNGDRRRSIRARQEPGAGFSLEEAYESLSNRRDLDGDRKSLRLQRTGRVFGNAELQRVATRDRESGSTTRGARRVGMAVAGVRWMRMESSFGLRREESEIGTGSARTGSGFDEWRGSGAWILTRERGRFDLTRTVRQDKRIDASSRANRGRAGTWDAHAVYQPVGRLLDLRYTRRDFSLGSSTTRSDLAGLLWSQEESSGRFSQQLRADLTTQDQASRTKSIEYVGPGLGNYDSLGVYVGSGDYGVVLRPSGDRRLERRLDGSWRIEFAPGRGREATPQGLASSALWSSQWLLYATTTVRTAGSAGEFWDDLPSLLAARKAGVPLASYRLRMEASALPQARWAGPQVRVERERSRSNDLSNVQSDRERDLAQLTLRSTPTRAWTLEQEVQGDRDVERTRFTSGTAAGASGWRSARVRFGGWFRPREGWTTRLGLIGRRRTRVETGGHYEITQVVPGLQWVGPKRTRVDLQATRSWVSGPGGQPLGLERGGWEGRGSLALKLHTYLDATAIWEIRAPDTGARQTTARAEVRSVF